MQSGNRYHFAPSINTSPMPEGYFNIVFCADHTYLPHTAVAIRSLVDNASDAKRLHLWLLTIGVETESHCRVMEMATKLGVRIDFRCVSLADEATLHVDRHISRETYCRLLLPDIIDESISSCLYLDSDLIVLDDILLLEDLELGNNAFAAADDYYIVRNSVLSMSHAIRYFNAGVVLLNLDLWRQNKFSNRVINYIKANPEKLLYWDQDAMNAVLYEHRQPLPLRWNHQVHFDDCLNYLPGGCKTSEMQAAMSNPAIVHFVGPEKPWHYLCLHPHRHLYHHYRLKTPWGAMDIPKPDMLPSFIDGRRIAIFGAGKTGKVTIRQYRQYGCEPEYLIDNDPLKIGRQIEGLPILSSTHLLKENPESMVIVIASMYRDEIKMQLESMGLQEFRHFVVRGFEPHLKTQ